MTHVSRRRFVALAAAGATAPLAVGTPEAASAWPVNAARPSASQATAPTAQALLDRVQQHIGVPWHDDDVDGILAGDPATVATGVVTTSMATLDVLHAAAQIGANIVVTAAPVFYTRPMRAVASGSTAPDVMADDPVLAAKRDVIERHGLVVIRLARHWHQRVPDPRAVGLATRMGWATRQRSGDGLVYDIASTRLDTLARDLITRLGIRGGLRAIGDRALVVRRVGLLPGVSRVEAAIAMLPGVDAIVAGEVWEWETAAYVQDVVYAGLPKGLLSIGRAVSEAPGMQLCAEWLGTIVPEVPVRFIDAGDPYWRPR